jgi:hypothetical protein
LLCERYAIPIPTVNRKIYGIRIDTWWPQFRVAVELDGTDGHASPERIRLDRDNELTLRKHDVPYARYSEYQVTRRPIEVRDDVLRLIARRD